MSPRDNPKATGESVTLFERLNFAWDWDNEDMAIFETLDIDVEAYAVQAYGFTDDDCSRHG